MSSGSNKILKMKVQAQNLRAKFPILMKYHCEHEPLTKFLLIYSLLSPSQSDIRIHSLECKTVLNNTVQNTVTIFNKSRLKMHNLIGKSFNVSAYHCALYIAGFYSDGIILLNENLIFHTKLSYTRNKIVTIIDLFFYYRNFFKG